MANLSKSWARIRQTLKGGAISIVWEDQCHKIYILVDEQQHERFEAVKCESLIRVDDIGVHAAEAKLREWFDNSCHRRFIAALHFVPFGEDPAHGFETLIEQRGAYSDVVF